MTENIIARRTLLGTGALALAMPPSKAEAIDVPHEMNVRLFGAVGNGTHDDTRAIQKAVDWTASANRGTLFFPVGTYRITAPITFETPVLHIGFLGEPGALIIGDIPDALLKRSVGSPQGGVHVIDKLRFKNPHPSGKGVMFHRCVAAKIVNCQFMVTGTAIETFGSQSITVDTCSIIDSKVGIMAGNATTVRNCDITHCIEGIRHHNLGLTVHGGRYEVNRIAIKLGYDPNDEKFKSTGFDISGLSMKSNQTGIHVGGSAAGKIYACAITGGVSMDYGLDLLAPHDVLVAGVSVSGSRGFTGAGIRIVNPTRTVFMGVSSGGPRAWQLPTGRRDLTFIQTNEP